MIKLFGQDKSTLSEVDNFLNDSDLILVKLNDIRQVYRELQWDIQLPDQMNILAYSFGQKIFDRREKRYINVYKNMSVFYHRQTDSCYLICKRSYYTYYLSNFDNIIEQIQDYAETTTDKLGPTKDMNWNIPQLDLEFDNPKHLYDIIDELSRRY